MIHPLRNFEAEKRAAAQAAAELVPDGARVGLGTGTTVAYLLPALAARRLDIECAATSPATERAAIDAGLRVRPLAQLGRLDIAIDGADQIAPNGWLVKGGGGAHTREKIVAAAAERFVVIAASNKLVNWLHPPVPLEVLPFGLPQTLASLGFAALRGAPASPDGNLIADYRGPISDPAWLSDFLSAAPGVVEHGLFHSELVSEILVGRGTNVERVFDRRFHRCDGRQAASG